MNKKALAVAIAGALAIPMSASAVQYTISGHVNREIRYGDDGKGSDVSFVDNGASMSRINFKGSEDIGNGLKAGVSVVVALHDNPASSVGLKTNDLGHTGTAGSTLLLRESNLFFQGGWGKVTLGQGSTAADGTLFADLSGTFLADEVSSGVDHASSVGFRTAAGGFTGGTVGGQTASFDGNRVNNVRYDTPAFGPVTLATSVGQNSRWDIAGFANTSLAGGQLSGAVGYMRNRSNGTTAGSAASDMLAMSASFLFSQGTSITGAYGRRMFKDVAAGTPDASEWYIKLGHQWGQHALSISYGDFNDMPGSTSAAKLNARMWGIGWVYTMRKDVELYAGYHNIDPTGSGNTGVKSVDIATVGSRIKF